MAQRMLRVVVMVTAGRRHEIITREPTALVLTTDGELLELVERLLGTPWRVEYCSDARAARFHLNRRLRLAVVDDSALGEGEQTWFVDTIHRLAPEAMVVYVASLHAPELERTVRSHGVLWYTGLPVDVDRLSRILARCAETRRLVSTSA
jgi:DNA-binding NtrC family response regulator